MWGTQAINSNRTKLRIDPFLSSRRDLLFLCQSLPPDKNVISSEAAHAFVSRAVEKSASLPRPPSNQRRASPLPFPFFVVIPQSLP
jgi:hypothetical protein